MALLKRISFLFIVLLILASIGSAAKLTPFNVTGTGTGALNLTDGLLTTNPAWYECHYCEYYYYVDYNTTSSGTNLYVFGLTSGFYSNVSLYWNSTYSFVSPYYPFVAGGVNYYDNTGISPYAWFKVDTTSNSSYIFNGSGVLKVMVFQEKSNFSTEIFNSVYEIEAYNDIAALNTPANGSTQYKSYPPLISAINFTWDNQYGRALYSPAEIIIAKDINFNLISADITTSNNYSVNSLEAGAYWWKVRYYNSTTETYSNWSNVFNFTLTNNQSITGAGIQGTIYELIGTAQTPLNGATVYIYNSTWSNTQIVGSTGYYLFDGLSNGSVYYVKSVLKDYQNSEIETVNVSGVITRNILMKKTEPVFFEPDKHYVLFKARWLYCLSSCDISGATINVYKTGEVIPYATGITDSTGSVSFLLYKTQLYRITIVKASEGVNKEETLYPKDTEYIFLITNSPITWKEHTIEQKDAINITISKNIINSTHTYINISYNDTLNQTTSLNFGITTNNTSVGSWTGAGNKSQSFIISNYSGKSYLVHINGTHTTYGSIDQTYSVFFEKSAVGITGIPEALWLWFMIGIMFFTAAVFTSSLAEIGLIIVCAEGWIGLALGAFSSINTTQFGIGLTLVSILGVLAYIKKQSNKEGLS